MLDYEIDDYNQEYFYGLADEAEEYSSIMEDWDEPSPREKDMSYNIFTLEQIISILNELADNYDKIKVSAHRAAEAIDDFIKQYTEICKEN